MECAESEKKVSQLVSKMQGENGFSDIITSGKKKLLLNLTKIPYEFNLIYAGLEEYTMDLQTKQVTMRGNLRWSSFAQGEENSLRNTMKKVCRQLLCLIRMYVTQRRQMFESKDFSAKIRLVSSTFVESDSKLDLCCCI